MSERMYNKNERHCKKCQHHTTMGGFNRRDIACVYILDVGVPRGCPFGVGCDKFAEGKPLARDFTGMYSNIKPEAKKAIREEQKKREAIYDYKGAALKRMRIKE